jgi:SAM-dependent methyltransferase
MNAVAFGVKMYNGVFGEIRPMKPRLLAEEALEQSAVVANCRMNREREVVGTNSYAADLRINPVDFLKDRLADRRTAAWLDLCCGTGRALIQAARHLHELGLEDRATIHGVDLVAMFDPVSTDVSCLTLKAVPAREWTPQIEYDLITCVHGLHYVGDKLGLIARAASWLKSDGLFIAHLDLDNVKLVTGRWFAGSLGRRFRQAGLVYDRRHLLISCRGKRAVEFPYMYEGADDSAGPNFTGQPAVDSYYSRRLD